MARTTTTNRPKAKTNRNDLITTKQVVTDKMIARLQAGVIPWQRTWATSGGSFGMPRSLSTGKAYRGINVTLLQLAGVEYSSSWWGTYDHIAEAAGLVKVPRPGGKGHFWVNPEGDDRPRGVRKGETGTRIIWWNRIRKEEVVEGKKTVRTIVLMKEFSVFNVDQAAWPDGLPKKVQPAAPVEGTSDDPIEAAEALVAEYLAEGPTLCHGGDQAYYRPATDTVQLPAFADFHSAAEYHSTLFHELGHSTGHDSRLKRDGIAEGTFGTFGSGVYSQEELVAEMTAAMLCSIAGIDQEAVFDNSAAYIAHWIKKLEGDNDLIFKAASAAQKAVDCILGTKFDTEEEAA